jgi:hypothetical protein
MRGVVLKISSPTAPAAVVAVVLVAAIGVSAPIGGAAAKDCIGTPPAPSPHGQHWYYRIDRATGHHCWYLRGFLSRPHREAQPSESHLAAAQSTIAAPPPPAPRPSADAAMPAGHGDSAVRRHEIKILAQSTIAAPPPPAPRPSADAAMPAGHGDSAVRRHEIKILNVSTVQFADPPTVQAPQSTQQPMAASPVPPAATAHENKDPLNTASSTAAVDAKADGANPSNAASGSPDADHAMKPEALATIGPTEMFFLLVLGIGLATFVLGVVIKIVGGHRALPIQEDPDSAWRRYRLDHRRPDPEAANALASPAWTALRAGPAWAAPRAGQSRKPAVALTDRYASGPKELEPALRALAEARQPKRAYRLPPPYRDNSAVLRRGRPSSFPPPLLTSR